MEISLDSLNDFLLGCEIRQHFCLVHGVRSSYHGIIKASTSGVTSRGGNEDVNEIPESSQVENKGPRTMFLAKLAIALGIVSTVILLFISSKDSAGSSFTLPLIIDGSSQSAQVASSVGFTFSIFGYRVVIPEYAPGWIYFWLLMAAACGFCISEELGTSNEKAASITRAMQKYENLIGFGKCNVAEGRNEYSHVLVVGTMSFAA